MNETKIEELSMPTENLEMKAYLEGDEDAKKALDDYMKALDEIEAKLDTERGRAILRFFRKCGKIDMK